MRKRYSREFKEEAVRLASEAGRTIKQVSEELGINYHMLITWRKELQSDPLRAFPGSGHPKDEELVRLRRENRILRQERDILKKAMAIFAPQRQGNLQ